MTDDPVDDAAVDAYRAMLQLKKLHDRHTTEPLVTRSGMVTRRPPPNNPFGDLDGVRKVGGRTMRKMLTNPEGGQ